MTRRIKILIGMTAVLAFALVAQVAVYATRPSTATMTASWRFHPQTVSEARNKAQSIVLAEVVSVKRGDDIVTHQAGEPDGVDRIPTQRITVKVVKGYKGTATAGQELTLFQTGGTVLPAAPAEGKKATTHIQQLVLEGDPFYKVGQSYLLMLESGPQGTLRPVSPEGRYLHNKTTGALTAMVKGPVADEMTGKSLTALETTLRAQN